MVISTQNITTTMATVMGAELDLSDLKVARKHNTNIKSP